MGNRAECPACKACNSNVYADLHFNFKDCQYCGCPHELLVRWEEMQSELEQIRGKKTHHDLVKRIDELFCENAALQAKFKKMFDLMAYRDDIFNPLLKVREILENE